MKFSTRTLYGLKAVLVLASRFGEGSLSVAQIAKKEGISVAYLEQILNGLKKKGFVRSVRGPQGGYVLVKQPSEISLKQLFYALENVAPAAKTSADAADEISAANALFWKKFKNSLEEGLDRVSLQSLIDEARRLKKGKAGAPYTFHI